jgi:hypothetical protein
MNTRAYQYHSDVPRTESSTPFASHGVPGAVGASRRYGDASRVENLTVPPSAGAPGTIKSQRRWPITTLAT